MDNSEINLKKYVDKVISEKSLFYMRQWITILMCTETDLKQKTKPT